jgi:imidazolonepropionase-like amidohydrolase
MSEDASRAWTRRQWLATAAAAAGVSAVLPGATGAAGAQTVTADLLLVNGRFVDYRGLVAGALAVNNGRIAWLGQAGETTAADRVLDLGGRTVIPGLFDGHVHFTRAGVNPGYEARRVERAFSIAALQEVLKAREPAGSSTRRRRRSASTIRR